MVWLAVNDGTAISMKLQIIAAQRPTCHEKICNTFCCSPTAEHTTTDTGPSNLCFQTSNEIDT